VLAASEQIETDQLDTFVVVGELALAGSVRAAYRASSKGQTRTVP
jgi:predicted ATPase with chaperone activity